MPSSLRWLAGAHVTATTPPRQTHRALVRGTAVAVTWARSALAAQTSGRARAHHLEPRCRPPDGARQRCFEQPSGESERVGRRVSASQGSQGAAKQPATCCSSSPLREVRPRKASSDPTRVPETPAPSDGPRRRTTRANGERHEPAGRCENGSIAAHPPIDRSRVPGARHGHDELPSAGHRTRLLTAGRRRGSPHCEVW